MKLTLLFAAAALAAPAKKDFPKKDPNFSLADHEKLVSQLEGDESALYSYRKNGATNIVVDEVDYGWNNNCYVGAWGKKKVGNDGVERTDAWVVCMKAERRLAHDVRKVSETFCVEGENSSHTCTVEESETKSTEEGLSLGFDLKGFTSSLGFSATQEKTHAGSQTFEQSCTGNEVHLCEIGAPSVIEYDIYAGWVNFESWRYPEEEAGPQWWHAGDNYEGMWAKHEMHQLYNNDQLMGSSWYNWKLQGDACNLVPGKYNAQCEVKK
ncbi:hypothetical protein DICA1_F10726 [Diutina catenulata]